MRQFSFLLPVLMYIPFFWHKPRGSVQNTRTTNKWKDMNSRFYLLSNLFFHLDGRSELSHLTDALAGVASVLPQHIPSGVRRTDQSRPVVGAS